MLVENRRLQQPTSIWRPRLGWPFGFSPKSLASENLKSPVLSYSSVCMILGLAILVDHRLVTDRHDDSTYHALIASRGRKWGGLG